MGHESVVYGCILGTPWKHPQYRRLQKLNKQILTRSPSADRWPYLTKTIFSVPKGYFGLYKSQAIHFGATYDTLDWSWNAWLEQFEQLLAKLYWSKVYLHLRAEIVGNYDYQYKAVDLREQIYEKEPPHPATVWEFKGGPRNFEQGMASDNEKCIWRYENGVWQALE